MKNEINSNIFVFDIPQSKELTYELTNINCSWVNNLLVELNSDAAGSENSSNETSLSIELTVSRKFTDNYKEHVLISATILGDYQTTCIKCLEPAIAPLNIRLSSCFLVDSLQDQDEFTDVETLYLEDKEWDLYYYQKRKIDLMELIHEYIYLHLDPFPLHEENCKGLCGHCGINLNISNCQHQIEVTI